MSPSVTFHMPDVKAEVSKDPWQLRDDFLAEIDIESIAHAVTAYSTAAEEAESAEDLARIADEQNAEAATVDGGISLSNSEQRLADTLDDLSPGSVADTVGVLHKTVELADATMDDVSDEVSRPGGLNTKISDHSSDAVDEANLWNDELKGVLDAFNAAIEDVPAVQHPVITVPKPAGSTASGLPGSVQAETADGVRYTLPDWIYTDIRQHFLDKAVEDAEAAAENIEGYIEEYRAELTRLGAELDAGGYDLGNGPLGLWHTPEMAEYHAEVISDATAALAENPDDAEALERLRNATAVMGSMTDDLFDADGRPVGEMPDAVREYLEAVYDGLEPSALATIGTLATDDPDRFGGIAGNVADSINALTNPAVGGIDPTDGALPDSLAYFLDGTDIGPPEIGPDGNVIDPGMIHNLEVAGLYNGFGGLMANATVPPGTEFGAAMMETAVQAQDWWDRVADDFAQEEFDFTGGVSLLTAGSMNPDAATEFLITEENAENLLRVEWPDDGDAAAEAVRVGTIPPEGEAISDRQAQAAQSVVLVTGDLEPDEVQVPLQQAVADVGITYMESLAGAHAGGSDLNGEVNGPHDIFGDPVPGFTLSEEQRRDFFGFLAGSDEQVETSFVAGLQAFHYTNAHNAFAADDPEAVARMASYAGVLDAEFQRAQFTERFEENKDAYATAQDIDKVWRTGASVGLSVAGILVPGGTAAATALNWTGVGNSLLQAHIPSPSDTAAAEFTGDQYNAVIDQGRSTRYLIAQAAADTDYRGAAGAMADSGIPSLHGADPDDLAVQMASGNFVPDLSALEAERWDMDPYMDQRERLLVGPITEEMEDADIEPPRPGDRPD